MVDYNWIIFWILILLVLGAIAGYWIRCREVQKRDNRILNLINIINEEIEEFENKINKRQKEQPKVRNVVKNEDKKPEKKIIEREIESIGNKLSSINRTFIYSQKQDSSEKSSLTDHQTSQSGKLDKNIPKTPEFEEHKEVGEVNTFESEPKVNHWDDEKPPRRIDVPHNDPLNDLKDYYNLGVNNRSARPYFWDKYPEVFRIGNKNAVEQALGISSKTEFREVANGDFLAIENPKDGNYLVVPQFDITIENTTYQEGGIGVAFICQNYDPASSYSNVKVVRPAIFERNGDKWKLIKEGELIL